MTYQKPIGDTIDHALLDNLYAELPTIDCQGLCWASCGPISMSEVEWERLSQAHGGEPIGDPTVGLCPILTEDKRCSCYTARPLICRMFGLTEDMPCPHGCRPSRVLTKEQAADFLRRVWQVSSVARARAARHG